MGWTYSAYDKNTVIRRVWESTPSAKRPLGQPRMRWRDNIKKEHVALGVDDLESSAQDRGRWKQIVYKAKIHIGL